MCCNKWCPCFNLTVLFAFLSTQTNNEKVQNIESKECEALMKEIDAQELINSELESRAFHL